MGMVKLTDTKQNQNIKSIKHEVFIISQNYWYAMFNAIDKRSC